MRMRLTIKKNGKGDMKLASDIRQDLWKLAPVRLDQDYPLSGIHRDEQGQVYLEFATSSTDKVHEVLQEKGHVDRVELKETDQPLGEACLRCGNVSGPVRLTVCPNCGLRDITPCPLCRSEVPREKYLPLGGNLFRCPECQQRVRLRFNEPLVLDSGDYNSPLVVVDEVLVHEVR